MENSSPIKYGKYMTELISSVICNTAPKTPFEGMNWQIIYQLSVFHNVAVLIYPAVKKLSPPEEILKKFEYNYHRMMCRDTRLEIEAQRIFAMLESDKIPYLKLKGIYLKHLYPAPYMRTHSDVDICVSKEDREKLREILTNDGYELEMGLDYHDEYRKDNFYIYEIHSDLLTSKSAFHSLFEDPFTKAKTDGESQHSYILRDEYFYLHLLVHLYKHFVSEGCGIRLFADLYIFRRNHPDMDEALINDIIVSYGLEDFQHHVNELIKCFFEGQEYSERYSTLAEFIFTSGEYGHADLKRIPWITKSKTANISCTDKIRYFFGNWFPPVKMMKSRYPVLERAPYLLPVCWVRRIFYTLFFKRSALKTQQKEFKRLNDKKLKNVKTIHNLAGIK